MSTLGMQEFETEMEEELEYELEGELEGEEFIGALGSVARGLLGEGEEEGEFEGEFELEGELEFESEEFLRRIGGFIRRAAPVLGQVARVAAPIVGTAVGGPLGGMIGRAASTLLREGEFEDEFEGEGEFEEEFELEGEFEEEAAPASRTEAVAEMMAAVASQAQTEAEAEAMAGAATVLALSPADRATLRRLLPHLVRGTAALTRILRRRRVTRPCVRVVPTIVRRTGRTLARRAASGQPVTRRTAGRVMASQTRRVLANPRATSTAMGRNVRATRVAARSAPVRRPTAAAR